MLYVLSYVGICTSTGQVLEIPILLRSLAASIGTIDEDRLSLAFNHDFLMTLIYQNNIIYIAESLTDTNVPGGKVENLGHSI